MRKSVKKRKRTNDSSATFFLVLLLIILFVVAYVLYQKKDSIIAFKKNLETKNKVEEVKKVEPNVEKEKEPEKIDIPKIIVQESKPKVEIEEKPIIEKKIKEPIKNTQKPKIEKKDPIVLRSTQKKLYFIKYDDSSEPIKLEGVVRTIKYESSPLTQTLNTLFYGPNITELNKNLITMIPSDAKILSINIKKGIAYIDVNQAFAINKYGREGVEAQLKQLVWTAMEFSTVEGVQIMINGKVTEFLNEGVRINKPLTKSSFN